MKLAIITTNEERFIKALKDYDIAIVIINESDSPVIKFCEYNGIKYEIIDNKFFEDREKHDKAIMKKLDEENVELVILGGYRRLIRNREFLDKYGNKMINAHNSYLPNFPGARPHELAFKSGVKKSGYSIHFVDSLMDRGDIILQEEINIENCRNPQEVYDKITEAACNGILKVLDMFEKMKIRAKS